jgi:hypothetical protein
MNSLRKIFLIVFIVCFDKYEINESFIKNSSIIHLKNTKYVKKVKKC